MFVYLAGPIDRAKDSASWRAQAADELAKRSINVYNPAGAFGVVKIEGRDGHRLMAINDKALRNCDGFLLYLDGSPTVGSFRELQVASEMGVPVAIVMEPSIRPVYQGMIYLCEFAMYNTFWGAAEYLLDHITSNRGANSP
jgi:hypothetical protein